MEDYGELVERITRLLNTLDSTRVELCEVAKQLSELQSNYDKGDQTYLHKLELLDTNDVEAVQRFTKEWQFARNNRRDYKDLIMLVHNIIDAIPYKNYYNALPILKGNSYYNR